MAVDTTEIAVRPLSELDIESITRIDERVGGKYRPDFWEDRVARNPSFGVEDSHPKRVGGVFLFREWAY